MTMLNKVDKKFLLILVLAIFVRLFLLEEVPFRVDGDSARIALDGIAAFDNRVNIFTTGWFNYQNLVFYLHGLFLKLFGGEIFAMRIPSVLGGIFSIYCTYLFAKEMYGRKIALVSSFLLSILPMHVYFSRNGTDMIHTAWLLPLTFYFLVLGIKKDIRFFLLAGFTLGLSQYFYVAARLIPIVVVLSFIVLILKRWSIKKSAVALFLLLSASLITYSPMIFYYLGYPEHLVSRINQVGVIQSGRLEIAGNKETMLHAYKKHTEDAFLIFFQKRDDAAMHYFAKQYLPPIGSLLFAIGLLTSIIAFRKRGNVILVFSLLTGVILGGVMTIDIQAPRYIILLPLTAIVMANGIIWIEEKLKRDYRYLFIGILLLLYSLSSIHTFWKHETIDTWSYDKNTQIASYAGRYLSQKQEKFSLYFFGNQYMYYTAVPTLPLLTKGRGEDIPLLSQRVLGSTTVDKNQVFIVLEERKNDLRFLKDAFPNGITKPFQNPRGEILFWLFET